MTRRLWSALALAVPVAAVAMVLVLRLAGGVTSVPIGLPDPGALTTWGLPAVNLLSFVAAVVTVAALLVPLLTMTRLRARLEAPATGALRVAGWAATAWLLLGVAQLWLLVSDLFAAPLDRVSVTMVVGFAREADPGKALLAQLVLVLLLGAVLLFAGTARHALWALLVALAALVPAVLTGHAASGGSHDTAVVAMLLHLLPVVVWVGGVLALWWLVGGAPSLQHRAARRFSALAAWCFGMVAGSGLVSGWLRLGSLGDLVGTGYGRVVLLKVALLALVGVVASRLRRTVREGDASPGWRLFARLSAIEIATLGTALGVGVALARTPPPAGEPYTSLAESLLGGTMPPAPTFERLLTSVQFSGVGLAAVSLGTAGYVAGLVTLRRRGDRWPVGRTIAWFAGLATLAYATLGGLGVYSHVMFSAHMGAHMVLSMMTPILLVLGAPINLALRALPGSETTGGDGPRQVLVAFLNSPYSRVVTNPAFATIMFIGSLYAIYFTGLYDVLMRNHLGHALMEVHFLLAGYLYYEILIGLAPLPRRLPHLGRLGLVVVVAPFHAFFAISVMSTTTLLGASFYEMLDRPYATDLMADQYLGGGITWGAGELPLLIVALVLLVQWFRDDTRRAAAADRRAEKDDRELREYNEMLARISAGTATRADRDPVTRSHSDD